MKMNGCQFMTPSPEGQDAMIKSGGSTEPSSTDLLEYSRTLVAYFAALHSQVQSFTSCLSFHTLHLLCVADSFFLLLLFFLERDLFGAEPFDPFSCGAGDFPPDIQSKLDEMQVTKPLPLQKCCFYCHVNIRGHCLCCRRHDHGLCCKGGGGK